MILRKAKIQNFRCIEDSGEFDVDPTTCLVGKNESGKTAILEALRRIKPSDAGVRFEPSRDFPKRFWRPGEVPPEGPVVTTKWTLEDADVETLSQALGLGSVASSDIAIEIGYDNKRVIRCSLDEAHIVSHFLQGQDLSEEERAHLTSKTLHDLRGKIASYSSRSEAVEALANYIDATVPGTAHEAAGKLLDERVPTFLFFDNYSRLPGRVSLEQLIERKAQGQTEASDNLFLALLNLAGTTPESLHAAATFEEFNSRIRALSITISNRIFEYWTQNQYLEADIKLMAARPKDPPPFNSGHVFHLRISNTRHKADTSFDERSAGFVWFFSFLIWFDKLSSMQDQRLVILLDEPGLTLHARAQADLLRYVKEKLSSHQVLYTTHSPFMVDPDNLMSARTVEDVVIRKNNINKLLGTQVRGDVLSTDEDTVSPLQRALDYELTQTLFVGRNTLLVEGPSDVLYIRWFSEQLRKKGHEPLDYRWVICYAGGVDRIPGFVSLFRGNRLNIAALVDVQEGHRRKLEKAEQILGKESLLRVTDFITNRTEGDIEDLLGRRVYIEIVRRRYGLRPTEELPKTRLTEAPSRVAKEVEAHFAALPPQIEEFDHCAPAEWLIKNTGEALRIEGMDTAITTFGMLAVALNSLVK